MNKIVTSVSVNSAANERSTKSNELGMRARPTPMLKARA